LSELTIAQEKIPEELKQELSELGIIGLARALQEAKKQGDIKRARFIRDFIIDFSKKYEAPITQGADPDCRW
jgi:hypothetical protein